MSCALCWSQGASPTAVYVHIPFCRRKCTYCDFNSYSGLEDLQGAYEDALLQEIGWLARRGDYAVRTVYVGGGTPTVFEPSSLIRILRALSDFEGAEISVEANPGTFTRETARELRRGGFNRLSLGIQSVRDLELVMLGRIHDGATGLESLRIARDGGFDNLSADLMFGLPGQTLEEWRESVERVLLLEPAHISAYALTVESGTEIAYHISKGTFPPIEDDLVGDMYEWTEERLRTAGYEHYEISNWALPGRQCQHNLAYWNNEPYLGVGAGAWSYWRGFRWGNVQLPGSYVDRCRRGEELVDELEAVPLPQEMADTVIMGLRLTEGVKFATFAERFDVALTEIYAAEINELLTLKLLESDHLGIRLTDRGRLLGNEVFVRFLPRD